MDLLNIKSWFSNHAPEPIIQEPVKISYENTFYELKNIGNITEQNDKKLIFDGYITNLDVYSINKRICDCISDVEIELYKYLGKEKKEIEDGDLYNLFRNTSTYQTWKDFIWFASLNLNLTGNLYIHKIRLGTKITSLKVLKSVNVTIIDNTKEVQYYQFSENGYSFNVEKDDIIHVKYENPYKDTFYGLSPLQSAYATIQTSNECNNANANLLANRGISAIVSSPSNEGSISMMKEDARQLQSAVTKKVGGSGKANGLHVTSAQLEVHTLGMSASDLEIIRSQEITLRQLCRLYGANSQIFGDTSSSTYNNIQEATKSFYINCVLPILGKIVRSIENDFKNEKIDTKLKNEFKNIEIEICKDEIEALQEDEKLKIEKQRILSDAILSVIKDYNLNLITFEQAESILLDVYGFDAEEVKKYLKNKPKQVNKNE